MTVQTWKVEELNWVDFEFVTETDVMSASIILECYHLIRMTKMQTLVCCRLHTKAGLRYLSTSSEFVVGKEELQLESQVRHYL